MWDLIWIQTAWHTDGIPERYFVRKGVNFERKFSNQQKSMQVFPACKELHVLNIVYFDEKSGYYMCLVAWSWLSKPLG